jgi:ubiquinone/menaquinone biosynthesis C-methylase UbiE
VKKYIIIALCMINSLSGIEKKITTAACEWDAQLYANGNKVQYESAISFLKKNNINIDNQNILDIGCGTGDISAFLAQTAACVHGFDASNNMIQYAIAKYGNGANTLTFEQSFAENFSSQGKLYDLATAFFCFHWFSDKQQALQQISESLKVNGELLATFPTSDDPHPPRFLIGIEMIKQLYPHISLTQKLGRSEPTLQELETMLADTGFEIITCELQTNHVILPDRKAYEDFQRPVVMSRPFIQDMPPEEREAFLTEFINRVIPTFKKTTTNELIEEVTIRIVHARKVKTH